VTARTQKKLKIELCRVLRGEARIEELISRARRPLPPLRILELRVENRAHEAQTRILLRAEDSFGVLYRATSALADMNMGVSTAQVSTRDEEADDLFFVSAQGGGKIPDEDLPALEARLRATLQGET
jgi:UTP:GlnB (protein PII) uridylyltransferase